MGKRTRVLRSKDELRKELREQLLWLRHSCQVFDGGLEAAGKHIALSIRVLIHQKGQSRALLDQLGIRPVYFLDSAGAMAKGNLLPELGLVVMQMNNFGAYYRPRLIFGDEPPMRLVRFPDWWDDPVIKDKSGSMFSRKDLVLNVADTDGGAHVDPELDEAYMALSRNNSLGWTFSDGDVEEALKGRPELASMRQIAHEVLSTINRFVPDFANTQE